MRKATQKGQRKRHRETRTEALREMRKPTQKGQTGAVFLPSCSMTRVIRRAIHTDFLFSSVFLFLNDSSFGTVGDSDHARPPLWVVSEGRAPILRLYFPDFPKIRNSKGPPQRHALFFFGSFFAGFFLRKTARRPDRFDARFAFC